MIVTKLLFSIEGKSHSTPKVDEHAGKTTIGLNSYRNNRPIHYQLGFELGSFKLPDLEKVKFTWLVIVQVYYSCSLSGACDRLLPKTGTKTTLLL